MRLESIYSPARPTFVFADISPDGPARHYPTKTGKYWNYENREYINVKEKANFLSVGLLKNARKGRKRENISHVLCCSVDLDGINTLRDIKARISELDIDEPAIIESSPGKFQLKWYLNVPVKTSGRQFTAWQRVQEALGRAFNDFGVDSKPLLDTTRLLRNEYGKNLRNEKYPDKPPVITHHYGEHTDLNRLMKALSEAGYYDKGWEKLGVTWKRFVDFFKRNPEWKGTRGELSKLTNIKIRTLDLHLKRSYIAGILERKTIDNGRPTAHTQYRFLPALSSRNSGKSNRLHRNKDNKRIIHYFQPEEQAIKGFTGKKIEKGSRNFATFVASVALKVKYGGKITVERAIETLKPGYLLSNTGDNDFSYRQFCATVESGLRPGREFRFKRSTLTECGLL